MLSELLCPKRILVVGASANPNRVGGRVLRLLRDGGFRGEIEVVNPRAKEIGGLFCHSSVTTVPGPIDLAIIALSAETAVQTLDELSQRRDVASAIVFASGFGETGPIGLQLEQRLQNINRSGGIRLLGPNTLGFVNAFDQIVANFGQYPSEGVPAGPIALVTQSGAVGTSIAALARLRGLPVGYFIATGNEVDVDVSEALNATLLDERVAVGAAYIEGFRNGSNFITLAEHAINSNKKLSVLKVGRSSAGARATISHTGALAGTDRVFEGICRQFGVIRARDELHLLDVVEILSQTRDKEIRGRNLGIITMSGGAGILMADRAEEVGLTISDVTPKTKTALRTILPSYATCNNPVDVTAKFLERPALITEALEIMLEDEHVSAVVVWLSLLAEHSEVLVDSFTKIRDASNKPFAVAWVAASSGAVMALRKARVPVFNSGSAAIDGIAALAQANEPIVPRAPVRDLPAIGVTKTAGVMSTIAGEALLSGYGVSCARTVQAMSSEEAVAAAEKLGFPVVLKIDSPDIQHKTEVDGICLGLRCAREVSAAYNKVINAAARFRPDARAVATVVQESLTSGVEMAVGLRHDPTFGMVVMVGLGGISIEITSDVSFRLAPINSTEAARMIDELRIAPHILEGSRGRPGGSRMELAQLIANVSRFGAAAGPQLQEVDLNPVVVNASAAVAVDWLIVWDKEPST